MALAAGVLETVVEHARRAAPDECCGILIGTSDEIREALPARNIADEPLRRFLIDPRDHFEAIRRARRRSLAVLGFYHSHPCSGAEPSSSDRSEAAYPGCFYLIVGLGTHPAETRLFRLETDRLLECTIGRSARR